MIEQLLTEDTYRVALKIYGLTTLATFIGVWFIDAPYGRFARSGFGPQMRATLAWFIMELVALIGVPLFALLSAESLSPVVLILLGFWAKTWGRKINREKIVAKLILVIVKVLELKNHCKYNKY